MIKILINKIKITFFCFLQKPGFLRFALNDRILIDLGPEGGADGGTLVAEGTPKEVARNTKSHTGFLSKTTIVSLFL